MNKIFTIGFTQKTAEEFYLTLERESIDILLDIRLNNTSQLAAFSKYPDIEFFLNKICNIKYIHDINFAPTQDILDDYKKKKITWTEYENRFNKLMISRDIEKYIKDNYSKFTNKKICLLCSEKTANNCHRRLIAEQFDINLNLKIIHL